MSLEIDNEVISKQYKPFISSILWFSILALTLVFIALRGKAPWLIDFPEEWVLPIVLVLNSFMDRIVEFSGEFFRGMSAALEIPMSAIRSLLSWLPWSVSFFILVSISFAASGWKLAVFTAVGVSYILGVGLWIETMNSLALVAVSVPLAVLIGFLIGTAGFLYPRAERAINLTLDALQTIPAFAYLLPILLLFGFGVVVGLIAGVLYAFPPMVRNTLLGLRRVPEEVIESGLMSGATEMQLFFKVRVPSAARQILLGVNQATLAAFSMVVIASIIGGSSDIGWEVLSEMRKARFGESLVAGIVIALMAMIMDRITAGFANRKPADDNFVDKPFLVRHNYLLITVLGAVIIYIVSLMYPALQSWPKAFVFDLSGPLNDAIDYVIIEYANWIVLIKKWAFFYLMLPIKMGLEQVISPYSWGFQFTMPLKLAYGATALILVILAWLRGRQSSSVMIGLLTIILFFGLTRMPWPAILLVMTFLSWQLSGPKLALTVLAGLAYLLLSGIWPEALLSVYLCGIGVALSFAIGCSLGILASEFNAISRFLRPINDTLQTIPLFVLLIPFVMIFKIGEFTALLAIMAYAIVPATRYSEHGLRNVSHEAIEAAECMGCTRWQLLMRVKIPMALPEMMLGLNQTIMFGISMLVIAALVGTSGLGQMVYIGLGDGDFGVGMSAGVGMAVIAIIADRMTTAWSKKYEENIGGKIN
ncbi:ABC transporter permease subunit [Amylibacter sp.]|nr:ABC transporter permease subunit [Amylibacter sp.]